MLNKFQEIQVMLERAREHLEWLRSRVRHPNPDLSAYQQGWFVAEEAFDFHVAEIRSRFGECAGCMRNALNYFTCTLAEQDAKKIGKHVQFPIARCPEIFWKNRDSLLEGITDIHAASIEELQPYYAGNWIEDLRVFSNWYRHSGLIKVQKTIERPEIVTSPSRTYRIGPSVVEVDYNFAPAVALEDGRPVVQTLEEIHRRVCQAIDELKPLLEDYLRQFI